MKKKPIEKTPMKKIPNFEKRFKLAIRDHVLLLAEELVTEGYSEEDVTDNIRMYSCLPEPFTCHLRNCIRDVNIRNKEKQNG